jgi:PKD repeat protein
MGTNSIKKYLRNNNSSISFSLYLKNKKFEYFYKYNEVTLTNFILNKGRAMKNNKKKFQILLLSILLFSLLSNVVIGVENLSLPTTEDTYIDFSNPDTNYGDDNYLKVLSGNIIYPILGGESVYIEMISYLKFDLSSISNSYDVVKAVLEIYIEDNLENSGGINIRYCSDDSWDENQITWDNSPEYDENEIDSISDISINSQWYSFDVTDTVISEESDFISFVLVGVDNFVNIGFISKDNILPDNNIYKPKLTIFYTTNTGDGEPIANFNFSPSNPTVDDIVQFFDISEDYDGEIFSWFWDFGDGTNSNMQNPTKKYPKIGVYEVTLLVTDNDGFNSTIKRTITISQQEDIIDDGNGNIDKINGENETNNNINNDYSKSVEEKFFGMFTLTEFLIIVLIIVIIVNTIVFGIILLRR